MSWMYGGKGKGKGGGLGLLMSMFGGGYGGGYKGKGKYRNPDQKFLDKLKTIDNSLKIWVGGLGKDFSWKKLEAHFVEVTGNKPTLTHVYPKGTACIAVKTEEEVQSAISSMNGTELHGKTLEVDVWTQAEKKEGDKVKKSSNKEANKLDADAVVKLKTTEDDCKVWVGEVPDVTNKALQDHFTEKGCKPVIVKVMGRGSAVVTFATAGEVASAIAAVNGTELEGKSLQADVWTKRDAKAKKP